MNMHEKLAIAKANGTTGQPVVSEFDDNDTDRTGKNVTKSDLVVRLMTRFPPLSARDTDYAVRLILCAMVSALKQKKRIEIRGFGSFTLTYRPARVGRNPKSGEQVSIPCKWVPHFKAGKEMRERVDKTP